MSSDVVRSIYFDLHCVQRIAGQKGVSEDGIVVVGYAVPGDTFRFATTQHHHRIYRNIYCQIEGVVLSDVVLCIAHSVGIETGRVQ